MYDEKFAVLSVLCAVYTCNTRPVGVVLVSGQAKELDIVVAQLGDGAPAGAGGKLLIILLRIGY